jgi:phage terminase small subunit
MATSKRQPHGHKLDPAKQKDITTGLTPRQEEFCHAYLIDFNVAAAERRVGLSVGSGHAMLKNPKVRARIFKIRQQIGKAFDVTRERLMQELMCIVYSDISEIEGEDGKRTNLKDWSKDFIASVAEVEYDLIGDIKKVKRYDKTKAIELLSRMLGFNAPEQIISTNKNVNYNSEPLDKDRMLEVAKLLEDKL